MTLATALRRARLGRAPSPSPAAAKAAASPSTVPGSTGAEPAPRLRDWIGVLAMVTGQFLAIMDVQIVTSSLTQIQGGLSASPDEIAWVQTAYLIADVVMVPMSGTLSRMFSTRIVFCCATIGFTASSALCASATTLNEMILFRAMQGFCGGAISPTVFPVVYTKFRGPQLASLMVLISLILNLSSTLGPSIGGFLTDSFSWHWLFLVNIIPGIGVTIIVWLTIDIDRPELSLLRQFDGIGFVAMAMFLGCLEYALEEGPRWDWFSDQTILIAAVISGTAGCFFFWRVFTFHNPIVDLRTFRYRNFSLGALYTFAIGTGLYGATYLIPLFLAEVRGYSALEIGETVVVTGLAQMVMAPFTSRIAQRLDLRIMLAIGMALFIVAIYLTACLNNQSGFWELFFPQALRGFALMFCYLPANMISLGALPQDRLKSGASLYNLTRDLGGAIVLAMIGTIMNQRMNFHWNRLIENINPARPVVQHFLDTQTDRLSTLIPGDPHQAAVALLARLVQREALVMTFNDVILLLGTMFIIGLIMMPLVRKPRSQMAR